MHRAARCRKLLIASRHDRTAASLMQPASKDGRLCLEHAACEPRTRVFQLHAEPTRQRRKRQLKEYSKGMTRRIGLAQALINDPDLVLLDEPTSGLDPIGTRDMKDMILKLRDQGKTVVMCSHLLADVQDVCDRIAILYGGELKVMGRVEDLLKSKDQDQLLTSPLSDEALAEVKSVLAKHNAELIASDRPTTTLEELFLKTVQISQQRPGQRFVSEDGSESPLASSESASSESDSSK